MAASPLHDDEEVSGGAAGTAESALVETEKRLLLRVEKVLLLRLEKVFLLRLQLLRRPSLLKSLLKRRMMKKKQKESLQTGARKAEKGNSG